MPTLELSMIVKNGAAGLARCLRSVEGVADCITVGDTGSTDETSDIATRFGAQLVAVPWHNDFAAARNCLLAMATCEWMLFLDADEMLDPASAQKIPGLLLDPAVAAYDITARNYVVDTGFRSGGAPARRNTALLPEAAVYPAYFPSTNTRLFRRHAGIYFEHCVHETVADRITALGLQRKSADLIIHHFGYVEDATEKRSQKETLYYNLALKKVERSAHSHQANLEAGIAQLDHAKNALAALPYFETAIALDIRRSSAWLYAGICLHRLGRHAEAIAYLDRSLAIEHTNALGWTSFGDVCLQVGDYAKAYDAYRQALGRGDDSQLTLAKLGTTEIHLGRSADGIAKVEQAVHESPNSSALSDIYATAAFLAGKPLVACGVAERRLAMEDVTAFHFLLAATLHHHSNMRQEAVSILQMGSRRFPNDAEIENMLNAFQRSES